MENDEEHVLCFKHDAFFLYSSFYGIKAASAVGGGLRNGNSSFVLFSSSSSSWRSGEEWELAFKTE